MFVDLVVDSKSRYMDALYTYEAPDDMDLHVGDIVTVPFHRNNRERTAYVFRTNVTPECEKSQIKSVISRSSDFSLNVEMIKTISWMRTRYGIKYIDAIKCFLPPGKPARPGKEKEPYKDEKGEAQEIEALTDEQRMAVNRIDAALTQRKNKIFLIKGVTSSGKTEVYMQAIRRCLDSGRTAIMLVPEIALTKQIIDRFIGRFGKEEIAVLHSRLTSRERHDEWMRLRTGKARIAIGARIGVFAPLDDIGLIILDEEHESTYKSDQTPKYDTVDVAVKRLMSTDGTLILGSATPSVISYERAKEGIYELIELKKRYNETLLPEVRIVDMKNELRSGNRGVFSKELYEAIKETLSNGEQVILFLNRRGYSTYITCSECGETLKCPECGITLVYHKSARKAVCHYCGKSFDVSDECPSCGARALKYLGTGTEKVEEKIGELFPEAKLDRLDLDTAKNVSEIKRIIGDFAKRKTDILIGTQLVAKGLDFANVGLVGIVSADVSLNIPDYRSTERTFELVTQAAGRAGRGDRRGKVIIQTMSPDNFALKAAADSSYEDFFGREIKFREMMDYPPFTDLIACEFTSADEKTALLKATECRDYLIRAGLKGSGSIFEPHVTDNFKGDSSFRYHILIKAPKDERNKYIYYITYFGDKMIADRVKCSMTIDVNPYSSL